MERILEEDDVKRRARTWWVVTGVLGVMVGLGVWMAARQAPGQRAKERGRRFSGVRQQVVGAEYTEEDPATGRILVVRAGRSALRDGRVGGLFQTPLKPVVALDGVRVELRRREGGVILSARSSRGRLDPKGRKLTLLAPRILKGGCEFAPREVSIRPDGRLRAKGPVEVWREGRRLGVLGGFEGDASALPCPGGN